MDAHRHSTCISEPALLSNAQVKKRVSSLLRSDAFFLACPFRLEAVTKILTLRARCFTPGRRKKNVLANDAAILGAGKPISPSHPWTPDSPAELLPDQLFFANFRRSRRGAAPSPSGLTGEIMRLVLNAAAVSWFGSGSLSLSRSRPVACGDW